MCSKNNTEPTRRRLSKKAVVAISAVAVLALAGGAAFAVNAANQAKINAACQEASTSYELAAQAYVTAEQELSNVVTEAREEASRGYADTEEGTALLVQADQRLALGAIATEAPDCHSHETAEQISSQASGLDADTEAINALAADITEAVDEHVVAAATADYDTALTAYNEAVTTGEASYKAASETEGFAGSAEDAGKLEALRAALDAEPDMGEAPTTRAEVTALDEAIAAINAATTAVDEARAALDEAAFDYTDRIAAEKKAAEEAAAAAAAEAARNKPTPKPAPAPAPKPAPEPAPRPKPQPAHEPQACVEGTRYYTSLGGKRTHDATCINGVITSIE